MGSNLVCCHWWWIDWWYAWIMKVLKPPRCFAQWLIPRSLGKKLSEFNNCILEKIRRLKEGCAYLKVREIIHMKFQDFIIFSFQVILSNCSYNIKSYIFQDYYIFSIFCFFTACVPVPLHKKWSFPLRVCSVNVTKYITNISRPTYNKDITFNCAFLTCLMEKHILKLIPESLFNKKSLNLGFLS